MTRSSLQAASVSLFDSSAVMAQASGYFLDRMPTVKGMTSSTPVAINDSGQVAVSTSCGPDGSVIGAYIVKNGIAQRMQGMGVNNATVGNYLDITGLSDVGGAAGNGITGWGYQAGVYW